MVKGEDISGFLEKCHFFKAIDLKEMLYRDRSTVVYEGLNGDGGYCWRIDVLDTTASFSISKDEAMLPSRMLSATLRARMLSAMTEVAEKIRARMVPS